MIDDMRCVCGHEGHDGHCWCGCSIYEPDAMSLDLVGAHVGGEWESKESTFHYKAGNPAPTLRCGRKI